MRSSQAVHNALFVSVAVTHLLLCDEGASAVENSERRSKQYVQHGAMKQPCEPVRLLPRSTHSPELPIGSGRKPAQIARNLAMSHVPLMRCQRAAWGHRRPAPNTGARAMAGSPHSLLFGR